MNPATPTRAVFLDRDGVLNQVILRDGKPYPPESAGTMQLAPDAVAQLGRLKSAGFRLIVVTNQPDVARGKQTREAVETIHKALALQLPIDAFRTCYHDDAQDCLCRKPKPGLLIEAAGDFAIDLPTSYMVGDRWRDVDAGAAAGCRTVWIDYGYRERGPTTPPNARVSNLTEATDWIMQDFSESLKDRLHTGDSSPDPGFID